MADLEAVAAMFRLPAPPQAIEPFGSGHIHDTYALSCPGPGLPLGAEVITLEQGVRFLADHLQGDVYFKTRRPGHKLDRARTQMRLVESMEAQWDAMCAAVENL